MGSLAAFLLSIAGPVVVRALAFIGISAVTIVGVQGAFDGLLSQLQSSMGGMPSAMAQIAGLAGFPTAIGIVWGAFNARLALWITLASTRWITK